jgi:hypothetical protein
MSYADLKTYYEAIEPLKAQDWLMHCRVNSYPKFTEKGRSQFRSKLEKIAYSYKEKDETLSFAEFAKRAGVERV